MKLTSVERIERSQLIPSVGQTRSWVRVMPRRRSYGYSVTFAVVTVMSAAVSGACTHEPHRKSERATPGAVAALRLGMSEAEVDSLLGQPIARLALPEGGVERVQSHYSQAGGWRVLGLHSRVDRTGFTALVEFRSGLLTEAWLSDPAKGVCACRPGRCADGWANQCVHAR